MNLKTWFFLMVLLSPAAMAQTKTPDEVADDLMQYQQTLLSYSEKLERVLGLLLESKLDSETCQTIKNNLLGELQDITEMGNVVKNYPMNSNEYNLTMAWKTQMQVNFFMTDATLNCKYIQRMLDSYYSAFVMNFNVSKALFSFSMYFISQYQYHKNNP